MRASRISFIAVLIVLSAIPAAFCALAADSTQKKAVITGAVELGYTKQDVIKKMGTPDSPKKFDFFYEKGTTEVVVLFDDKTNKANSVIIRNGTPNYSISGIRTGDMMSAVKKTFGEPEKKIVYSKSGVECWYYPSKHVNFAFTGEKVASFSISNINVGK